MISVALGGPGVTFCGPGGAWRVRAGLGWPCGEGGVCLVGRGGFGFVLPSAGQVAWGAGPPRTVAHSACPSQWVLAFEIFIPLVLFFILLGLRQKKPTISVKLSSISSNHNGTKLEIKLQEENLKIH